MFLFLSEDEWIAVQHDSKMPDGGPVPEEIRPAPGRTQYVDLTIYNERKDQVAFDYNCFMSSSGKPSDQPEPRMPRVLRRKWKISPTSSQVTMIADTAHRLCELLVLHELGLPGNNLKSNHSEANTNASRTG